jgi:hypothetical protein
VSRIPIPTPIYRIVHIDNLATIMARGQIHAPSHIPVDGRPWRSIHDVATQTARGQMPVPCGPGGMILDYVGFYLGPRSPMLYRIHTGHNMAKIDQSSIVYLVSTAQAVKSAGLGFVFYDRHSLARVAACYDDLARLGEVDFQTCYATQWNTTPQFPDRQEKKQAEFLVHRMMPWSLVAKVGVVNADAMRRVNSAFSASTHRPAVSIENCWYY